MTDLMPNMPDDLPPSPSMSHEDLHTMAVILESRHGIHAVDIAEFFASMHGKLGDAERCWAWGGVANVIAKRERARMASTPLTVNQSPHRPAAPAVKRERH